MTVGERFEEIETERWDRAVSPLETREEVRAYCRHNYIPMERAGERDVPLWLTKRGVLIRAAKRFRCESVSR